MGKENDKGPREVDDIDIFWATGTFFFISFSILLTNHLDTYTKTRLDDQRCAQEVRWE